MNAKELSLGDKVYLNYGGIQEVAVITGLFEDGDIQVLGQSAYVDKAQADINPIPLTKDILKINGFEILYTITTSLVEYNGRVILTKNQGDSAYYFASYGDYKICIMYVHELQNILRLCKLDELADNFKLKGE